MITFLDTVAEQLLKRTRIQNTLIVLQTQRAKRYLKYSLQSKVSSPSWLPTILTVEEFVQQASGLMISNDFDIALEAFTLLQKHNNEITFESFLDWSDFIIRDFSDIDLYLLDAAKLFKNLDHLRAAELWQTDPKLLTHNQLKQVHFWRTMSEVYTELRKILLSKKSCYSGLVFRQVAENIDALSDGLDYETICFAGLNALSRSEELIIKALVRKKKAELIWDYDNYYIRNTTHKAGSFIRKYIKKANDSFDRLTTDKKTITIIGTSRNIQQVKITGVELDKLRNQGNLNGTAAVVLGDEKLLTPLLHSLPPDIPTVNISMGYSLKNSALASFVNQIVQIQKETERLTISTVEKVLRHEFIGSTCGLEKSRDILKQIQDLKSFYVMPESILDSSPLVRSLFEINHNPAVHLDRILNLISTDNISAIERHGIVLFKQFVKSLNRKLDSFAIPIQWPLVERLLDDFFSKTKTPFESESLDGLQVMGMLETRSLDFENLFILSVNENIFPAAKSYDSFIPFDIRQKMKLPTYMDHEAIFSYNFFRLLQRAKNIFVLYNTETDEFGNGERSRFITQITHELADVNPQLSITSYILNSAFSENTPPPAITIEKSDISDLMIDSLKRPLSPTGLLAYKSCSLQFYFKYVARFREEDEIEDNIQARTLGTIMHRALENLYKTLLLREIVYADIDRLMPQVRTEVTNSFLAESLGTLNAYNSILFEVSVQLIHKFLESDSERIRKLFEEGCLSYRIFALEQTFELQEPFPMRGKIDRVDKCGDEYLAIDYKTGVFADRELEVKDMSDPDGISDKAFQLLTYAYLGTHSPEHSVAIHQAFIFPFKKSSLGFIPIKLQGKDTISNEDLVIFGKHLSDLHAELADISTPFSQTNDIRACKYCTFATICNRQTES